MGQSSPSPKQSTPGGLNARLRRDTTPLGKKTGWIVAVWLIAGVCIGTLEGALGYRLWTLPVMVGVVLMVLIPVATTWTTAALGREVVDRLDVEARTLAPRARQIAHHQWHRPARLHALRPVQRNQWL